jgi:hypothetical protein
VKPPDFLKVLPADIGRVGVLGAAILALVRYVTGLPGETNGRKTVDCEMWWRASHDDIGQLLGGIHRDSVRRALVRLQGTGELLARTPVDTFYGDRAQAYRVPDLPLRGMQQGPDLPLRETAESITRNATSGCGETQQACAAKSLNLPLSEELEEEGEKARAAEPEPLDVETVPDPDNAHPPEESSRNSETASNETAAWVRGPYGPRCRKHVNDPDPPKCPGCRDAREAEEAEQAAAAERERTERRILADAKRDCDTCYGTGQVDVDANTVARCPACSTPEARQRLIAKSA